MTQGKPHRRATVGRIVLTPGKPEPYAVITTYEDGRTSQRPFRSIREGEAFLRDENAMIA